MIYLCWCSHCFYELFAETNDNDIDCSDIEFRKTYKKSRIHTKVTDCPSCGFKLDYKEMKKKPIFDCSINVKEAIKIAEAAAAIDLLAIVKSRIGEAARKKYYKLCIYDYEYEAPEETIEETMNQLKKDGFMVVKRDSLGYEISWKKQGDQNHK